MSHQIGFDAVSDFPHTFGAARPLIPFDGCLGVCVPSPDHRVLQARSCGDGGGDGRGSQGVEVQIRSSGVDFGRIEVVAKTVGRYVRSVRAGNYEVRRLLAVARFFYEFSELWRYGLCRVGCCRFGGFEVSVLVGGMAYPQRLCF